MEQEALPGARRRRVRVLRVTLDASGLAWQKEKTAAGTGPPGFRCIAICDAPRRLKMTRIQRRG